MLIKTEVNNNNAAAEPPLPLSAVGGNGDAASVNGEDAHAKADAAGSNDETVNANSGDAGANGEAAAANDGAAGDAHIPYEIFATFLQNNEVILRDDVIMQVFLRAIKYNANLFKDATVLEVGCGSAIFSMWAAKYGAARVIAVEPSDAAQVTRELVRQNHLDHVIEVLQGKIEDVVLPDGLQQVDIIISKWMGACLMFNSAMEDVIYARDKWLKPGGLIFPHSARLYMLAAEHAERPHELPHFWQRYHGLDLSHVMSVMQRTPLLTAVDTYQVVTKRYQLCRFDMRTLTRAELSFVVPFKLVTMRQSLANWFVTYFKVSFPGSQQVGSISTSPSAPETQWLQTVFRIDGHVPLFVDDVLEGEFKVARHAKHLDLDITWQFSNKLVNMEPRKQIYRIHSAE